MIRKRQRVLSDCNSQGRLAGRCQLVKLRRNEFHFGKSALLSIDFKTIEVKNF